MNTMNTMNMSEIDSYQRAASNWISDNIKYVRECDESYDVSADRLLEYMLCTEESFADAGSDSPRTTDEQKEIFVAVAERGLAGGEWDGPEDQDAFREDMASHAAAKATS